MPRPKNWYWNGRDRRFEMKFDGRVVVSVNQDGISVGSLVSVDTLNVSGQGSIQNLDVAQALTVGTLATVQALDVNAQGSVQNLRVATLANVQALNVNVQGSIQDLRVATLADAEALNVNTQGSVQNLDVGTLAVLQAVNVGGQGSITNLNVPTQAVVESMILGSGPALNFALPFVGSSALLAAVALGGVTVGTVVDATGVEPGDKVFVTPKSLNLQTGFLTLAGVYIPTTNVLNVLIGNVGTVDGSLPAMGWDCLAFRTA